MEKEIWKDIEGYEGLYQVSNLGRVKRFYKNKKVLFLSLKSKNEKGYVKIVLGKNANQKTQRVHRLVAQAFIPNPNNLKEINHIDGNKENNCVSNLEWCSRKDNMLHARKNGLISLEQIKYACDSMHKANEKKIRRIVDGKVYVFDSIVKAGLETNISKKMIWKYLNKKKNPRDKSIWEYV